ncbi:RtcB family protein [Neolewinella aurantiaca]|uniref:3'-phosphate/5'-hydroxy nucleic acid ligase n=1 Tax=Neolewinella aurantiaca TaxID=2602767 RepID=A0A5C7FMA6_9BACT|nr:RtcB family protein [Neolewinella aurantiaca]TXF91800.1 RtcB family protein [Neolewinella aurantiaca]
MPKLRAKDLIKRGWPKRPAGLAVTIMNKSFKRETDAWRDATLANVLAHPDNFVGDDIWGHVAAELGGRKQDGIAAIIRPEPRKSPLAFNIFKSKAGIAPNAVQQLYDAMRLPVAAAGALMPDAHHGYGLPIGGVLATVGAVIPYGVGVDIGCRMCLSVYDLPGNLADTDQSRLATILRKETAFGLNAHARVNDHAVLADETFRYLPAAKKLLGKAAKQLGSSGGGNHFVEFGNVELPADNAFERPAGSYLAVLSHSGSRGMGAALAMHYTDLAMKECRLPKQLKSLAWLDLRKDAGAEYWAAMTLAGDYASACHDDIHARIGASLGEKSIVRIENHHNFAWKDKLPDGTDVVVHRKGATPAAKGELGIIPGSMADPGFIVRGLGNPASLNSASHGAGRQLSRSEAKNSISGSSLKSLLKERKVLLIGGGLDEAPGAYKDIREVMAGQTDLVEVLGEFHPRVVRMA